ncbi:MAG TPA: hypothetical protein VGN57_17295 [Pirellulaceae bacterium]|jgi:hypothetical protein|nr:hypothetical protein [Pirellulaceae bacterium]
MSACDQVFERLTRGPFPGGPFADGSTSDPAEDARVERHLACCHDCRRLAEALRPAVDLFHEALERTDDLPRYGGKLREERQSLPLVALAEPPLPSEEAYRRLPSGARLARERAPELFVAARPVRGRRSWIGSAFDGRRVRDALFCVATVAASVTVAIVLAQFAAPGRLGERSASAATLSDADWSRFASIVDDDRVREWSLPTECASLSTKPHASIAATTEVACCTLCHAAGGESGEGASADLSHSLADVRPAMLLSSCATCHY